MTYDPEVFNFLLTSYCPFTYMVMVWYLLVTQYDTPKSIILWVASPITFIIVVVKTLFRFIMEKN